MEGRFLLFVGGRNHVRLRRLSQVNGSAQRVLVIIRRIALLQGGVEMSPALLQGLLTVPAALCFRPLGALRLLPHPWVAVLHLLASRVPATRKTR